MKLRHNKNKRVFMTKKVTIGSYIKFSDSCKRDGLANYSEQGRFWDVHRSQADDVQKIYNQELEFQRLAQRIGNCSGILRFSQIDDDETGKKKLKLRLQEAHFCRVRHCPVCQWRRSLMWQARFYSALPAIIKEYPKARFLFLTLTVKNCHIEDLSDTLRIMNSGWQRLKDRKEFKSVLGWIRSTEVTKGKDGSAHPHFHILLMVPPSWFTHSYVKKSRWAELWAYCARLDYSPVVDIRTVKNCVPEASSGLTEGLKAAVAETLKYSVKPSDMIEDNNWFLQMTKQVHRKRFIASGGVLKNILRESQETNEDLIFADNLNEISDRSRIAFNWRQSEKCYRRFEQGDII